MSERYDELLNEIFEEIDPEEPGRVTAVYIPENRVDLAQAFDIPYEYEAFKRVIGNDFFDIPLIPRKVLVFLSKENEGIVGEQFDLNEDLKGRVKGDLIIVMGDEKYVEDLDEVASLFYERKVNAIRFGVEEENNDEDDIEIIAEDENTENEEEIPRTEITADTKGGAS